MRTLSARLGLTLGLGLILTGCTMTAGDATKSAVCDQFKPIRWSSADTVETIRQVKEANAVGVAVCGWRP
ncbi:hypothetical protein J2X48_000700 [Bosea sp. BE271]|nr:hypothetical protein [Bosea sp. BE271]